jgi:hypothetical protein
MHPSMYVLGTPANAVTPMHPDDIHVRLQGRGADISRGNLIDISSELLGITRPNSSCPTRQYLPSDQQNQCGAQGGSIISGCSPYSKVCLNNDTFINTYPTMEFNKTEETRLSNPPSTLRGTGMNRWEWLHCNPQYNVMPSFDHQINSQLLAKDNHRPCLPRMMDQYAVHPVEKQGQLLSNEVYLPVQRGPRADPVVGWQSAANIAQF